MGWEANGRFGGRLSAFMYLLCGGLVAVAAPIVPLPAGANRGGLITVGAVALGAGVVIALLPWHRWQREATLWLVPPTFVLIALDNVVSGNDGYRYAPFFFVTFAWVGLVHRRWMSVRVVLPVAAIAYFVPLFGSRWNAISVTSAVFVLPACVLLGEAIAWVSERLARTQQSLREREESWRHLFADNPQPMWVIDRDTFAFLEVNAAAVQHYGYSRDEFLSLQLTDIRPPEDVPQLLAGFAERPAGVKNLEARHLLKDGALIAVEISSHELTFEGRPAVLAALQDVTQRNALEAELRHRAFHDPLTNLANRALFNERVERALARHARVDGYVAVLVADLDGFKTVNDSLGHPVGDALLIGVAERFRSVLRTADTAARLGGDEFAILLEDIEQPDEVSVVAGRLMDALAEPVQVEGKDVIIHVSIGIDLTNAPDRNADALLRNADTAMYRAKADGKGCYRFFEPAMHTSARQRMDLEQALRRAIHNNELALHYQPVVSIQTGEVVAFEALARWHHPTKGIVAPIDFIPLAEETGLITDIGQWAVREACRQTQTWRTAKPDSPISIAVNVSRKQLSDPDFVNDIAATISQTGIDPATLTLEITESVLAADPDAARQRLYQLRDLGVRIAIDDFGTGYSSLSTLRDLPVNTLKIDKAFIDDLTREPESANLVKAIVQLARSLDLETIAEGVEHLQQLHRLKELGCDQYQGYLFSRPLPPTKIQTFLRTASLATTRK